MSLVTCINSHNLSKRRRRGWPRLSSWIALALTLTLVSCVSVDQAAQLCKSLGARYEHRPSPDIPGALTSYCVFSDGSECRSIQFYEGTCTPPGMSEPLAPLHDATGALWPMSLNEMVSRPPLIFIGEVGPVAQEGDYPLFAPDGQPVTELPFSPTMYYADYPVATDYVLKVEEVIRDDGRIARGIPIILRMPRLETEETMTKEELEKQGYLQVSPGERYLFLLNQTRDGKAYTFRDGMWSRLIIDGEILRLSNATQDPLVFPRETEPVTLAEFIAAAQGVESGAAGAPAVAIPMAPPAPPGPAAVAVPAPTTLAELVDGAPLIFVGEVGPVERFYDFAGYAADGSLSVPGEDGAPPGIPATDFRLLVEQPLRDDGRIARGEPVILRMAPLSESDLQTLEHMGMGFEGRRMLFMLLPNPDGATYGPGFGQLSMMVVEGNQLRLGDGVNTPVRFPGDADPATLDAFVRFVKDRWGEVQGPPPSPLPTPAAAAQP